MAGRPVGRDDELRAGAALLPRLQDGPAAVVFAGEPGIGKTTLWAEAVDRLRQRGCVVLSARVAEAEAKLGFGALSDLLDPVADDVLAELPEPQRRAIAVALLREEPGSRALDHRAVGAATLGILSGLARTGSLIVAVDDYQWLDQPSARALAYAFRRLGKASIGVVASERVENAPRTQLDLRRVLPEGRVTQIDVGPLSLAALHEVLKERLGRPFRRRTLLRIANAAGGNPFYAIEIARSVPADAGRGLEALPMPDNLVELVEARISTLPKATRSTLLAAATLPLPTVEVIAGAVSTPPARSRRSLERAAEAGIVRLDGSDVRFSHPLFAAAVYSSARAVDRRRMHARLSELVEDPEERARHLALAAETTDDATAVVLDRAAEHARRRGAPDTAAALADHARVLTPVGQRAQIWRRTIMAAEYQLYAGELRLAREMLETVVAEAEERGLVAKALCLLGETHFHESSFVEAIPIFERALALAGEDPALRSVIEMQLGFGCNVAGDWGSARTHIHRARAVAEELGDPGVLAEALAVSTMVDYLLGCGLDEASLRRSLELEDPDRQTTVEMRPSLIAGLLWLYEGRLERAVEVLEGLRRRVLERGEDVDLPFVAGNLAWAEAWRGNLGAAAAYTEEALDGADRIESEPMRCWSLAFGVFPAAYAGDEPLTAARGDECAKLAAKVGIPIALFWAGSARANLALAAGDAQSAYEAVAPFVAALEERGLPEPIIGFFMPDAVEALAALGELERAERLLRIFHEAALRLDRDWALLASDRCRARLDAAHGRLDDAAKTIARARELAERVELRLEVARTLLVAGQIERRRRRKRSARASLDEALAIFDNAGAWLWAEKTRAELARVRIRHAAANELTESERRVAELAASGLRNREVAARLFMSPKTVEANLARAYRKLDIHSRAELGARLAKT